MRLSALLAPDIKQLLQDDPEQVELLLDEIHAEDLADIVASLDPDAAATLIKGMRAGVAAPIFERLDEHEQEQIISLLPLESVAQIASEMEADDRADLFSMLDDDVAERVLMRLEKVDPEAAEEVREIEKWPETSAGHLMTTRYVTVMPKATIKDALLAVRRLAAEDHKPIYNVYVVQEDNVLLGLVSVRDLILYSIDDHFDKEPSSTLSDVKTSEASYLFSGLDKKLDEFFRTNIISVDPSLDQEEVARRMAKYDLNAMPVLNNDGKLLGLITIDDIVDVLSLEQTEDVQKIGGVEPLDVPYFQTTFFEFIKKRGGWLVILFLEEFFTQTALRHYDSVFRAIEQAAYYVPLLISTGGNSGSQSSTLIIRGLAIGEIRLGDWWRILLREAGMGLVLGMLLGAIGFARVLMYKDQSVQFAFTVSLTLIGIVIAGCTVGSMLPLVLKRFGVDPATSSTPFIASLVDVFGIIIFVYCAKLVMADVLAKAAIADVHVDYNIFLRFKEWIRCPVT